MDPLSLAVVAGAASAVAAIALMRRQRLRRVLRTAASQLGLRTIQRSRDGTRWLEGFYRRVPVRLGFRFGLRARGSGPAARVIALLSIPMPKGLAIHPTESFWSRQEGSAGPVFGDKELDRLLHVQTADPAHTRLLLRQAVVRETLRRLCTQGLRPSLTETSLSVPLTGPVPDEPTLDHALDQVVDAVRRMEETLRFTLPANAPDPAPDPALDSALDSALEPDVDPVPDPRVDRRLDSRAPAPSSGPATRADELVAALYADGDVDSAGEFTLDGHRARRQLRRFQLDDPQRFILPLCRAAHRLGATRVNVGLQGEVYLGFDGRALSRRDLESLWPSLLTRGDDVRLGPLRQLALGCNAAFGWGAQAVEIRSSDGAEGVRLRLLPEVPDGAEVEERVTPIHLTLQGTEIEVKRDRVPRSALRALATVLRERCQFAPYAVFLGEEQIARGLEPPGALVTVPFDPDAPDPSREGVAALIADFWVPAALDFVLDGVWFGHHERPDLPPGLRCLVTDAKVRLDLGFTGLVRDQTVARIHAAAPNAARRAFLALAKTYRAAPDPFSAGASLLRAGLALWGEPAFEPGGEAAPLLALPLWPRLQGDALSSGALRDRAAAGDELAHADVALERPGLTAEAAGDGGVDPSRTLLLTWWNVSAEAQILRRWFGRARLHSVTDTLLASAPDRAP